MENRGRVLSVDFSNAVGRTVKASPLTAIDYGQILEIHGLPLPPSFECHFSKNGATAYKSIGTTTNGVGTVPFIDEQTASGGIITAYIYLHETEDDGETEYRIIIPVESRPGVTPAEPTPVQQDVIAQAISALNNAVTTTTANVAITEANKNASAQSASEAEADANRADTARNGAVIAQNSAQASADTASQKATEAEQAKDTAVQAKNDAIGAKNLSQAHALDAQGSATLAGQKATEADNSADLAQQYMTVATTKASQASQSEQIATQKATESAQSAQNAENDRILAVQAKNDAETAKTGAETAQGKAEEAQDKAEDFAESAQASADRAEQEADRWYEYLPVDTATGSLAHFTDGAKDVPVKALSVSLEPIQSGSGDPSPDNVRPITGHTQVVVTRTGKNLIQPADSFERSGITGVKNADGSMTLNGTATASFNVMLDSALVLKAGTYTKQLLGGESLINFRTRKDNVSGADVFGSATPTRRVTTLTEETTVYCSMYISNGAVLNNVTVYPMIYYGDVATMEYEPYTQQSITIPLGDTVYGGTLDVTNGVLTVDRAINALNGSSAYTINGRIAGTSTEVKYVPSPTKANGEFNAISSRFGFVSGTDVGKAEGRATSGNVFFRVPDSVETVADAQAWFGENPTQIVYELATPITVNLTPQQMTTLLGINNIWSDSGDVSVEYRTDIQLYIQKMIANAL